MIILDASALIAFLDPSDALHARAVRSLAQLGPRPLGLSPVTHAEVLVGPTRVGTLQRTTTALAALGVSEIALPHDAASRLARLRVDTRLKLPDCCVILAAQQIAGALLTFDGALAASARDLGTGVEGLTC